MIEQSEFRDVNSAMYRIGVSGAMHKIDVIGAMIQHRHLQCHVQKQTLIVPCTKSTLKGPCTKSTLLMPYTIPMLIEPYKKSTSIVPCTKSTSIVPYYLEQSLFRINSILNTYYDKYPAPHRNLLLSLRSQLQESASGVSLRARISTTFRRLNQDIIDGPSFCKYLILAQAEKWFCPIIKILVK